MTKPIFGQNLNCSNVQSCSKNDAVADQSTNKNAAATKESTASNQQGDNPEADGPNKENENEAKTPPLLPKITCPAQIAISMSGCGFLSSYHIGAMLCLRRHATTLLSNVHVYCGASAGALIASLMVLAPDKLEDALKRVYELADKVPNILMYTFDKTFNIDQHLAELVDQHLPQDISVANGKLSISLTKQKDFSNNLINRFPDRDHLMKCLFASCYIPYYTRGQPPIIDGEAYIDGGLSNNLPMISGMHTITISPFSGSAKIAPARSTALLSLDFGRQLTFGQQQFNISWANIVNIYRALYPRPIFTSADQRNTALISRYYEQGYRDTMNYLLKRGYYERGTGTEV